MNKQAGSNRWQYFGTDLDPIFPCLSELSFYDAVLILTQFGDWKGEQAVKIRQPKDGLSQGKMKKYVLHYSLQYNQRLVLIQRSFIWSKSCFNNRRSNLLLTSFTLIRKIASIKTKRLCFKYFWIIFPLQFGKQT